jgi:hypothetical protein
LQVQAIDRSTNQVTLSASPDFSVGKDLTKHLLLRRWDEEEGDESNDGLQLGTDNAALIKEGVWLDLEVGVQIFFVASDGANPVTYRTGDYWLIPARVATGNVEWPTVTVKDAQGNATVTPVPRPPLGITHHYAPLAIVEVNANGVVDIEDRTPPAFTPLVNPEWPLD